MVNPLNQYRSGLFGSRGCDIAEALKYVDELALASTDAVAVQTAARVLLNTCASAVDQVLMSRSPEKLAIIDLINERIDEWMSSNLEDKINDWMSDNLEDKINDHDFSGAFTDWMDDNLEDRISNLDLVVRTR